MAITVTNIGNNETAGGTATVTVTPGSNVPAGVHVFVATADGTLDGASGSVSDNGNSTTYTIVKGNNSFGGAGANASTGMLFCLPASQNKNGITTAQTITYTKANSAKVGAMIAFYVSNLFPADRTVPDGYGTANGSSSSPTVTGVTGGSTTGNVLNLGFMCWGTTGTFTQDAGFTNTPGSNTTGLASSAAIEGGSVITSSGAKTAYTPSLSASAVWGVGLFTYSEGPVTASYSSLTDLSPPGSRALPGDVTRTWAFSRFGGLAGQDSLASRQKWSIPKQPSRLDQFWTSTFTPIRAPLPAPFVQTDWPVPRAPLRIDETWSQSYDLNLIGKDQLPAGAVVYDRTPIPSEPNPRRSWTWQYIDELIGQDVLPTGAISYVLPPISAEPSPRRSWTWSYNYNLVGQDVFPTGSISYILPPIAAEPSPRRSWTYGYLLELIGQDQLPRNTLIYDRPAVPPWYRDWVQDLLSTTLAVIPAPFAQYDWQPARLPSRADQTWASWYNLNLVNQDVLPPNRPIYDRPPVPPWYREWIFGPFIPYIVTAVAAPFAQLDWPLPVRQPRPDGTWSVSYNLNLIGQDSFPARLVTIDNPSGTPWYREWTQNLLETTLRVTPQAPFAQFDWPLARTSGPQDKTWTWSYNRNLVNQDILPPNRPIYDRPPVPPWYREWMFGPFIPDIVTFVAAPFAQFDWPTPRQPPRNDQTWTWQYNLNLIAQDNLFLRHTYNVPQRPPIPVPTWTINLLQTTLFVPPSLPVGAIQYDLAPRGYPPLVPNYIYYEPIPNYPGFGQKPFAQYDWPLPVIPALQLQQRGFVFGLNPNLPPPVVTVKFEWIIRYRRRRRRSDQKGS